MLSLIYLLPIFYRLYEKIKRPLGGLAVLVLLGACFALSSETLIARINFPSIIVGLGDPKFFSLYGFVGATFALLPFFSRLNVNMVYLLFFGLVAANGDAKLILALLIGVHVLRGKSLIIFIISLLALIGEFVALGSEANSPYLAPFYGSLFWIFSGLFFLKLTRPMQTQDTVLDLASFILLAANYSKSLDLDVSIFFALMTLSLVGLLLSLRSMNLRKAANFYLGLLLLLFAFEGPISWPYFLGCAFGYLLAISDNTLDKSMGHFRFPSAGLFNLCGLYLLVLLFSIMVFKSNFYLGCLTIIGLNLNRRSISSLAGHLQTSGPKAMPLYSVALIIGFMVFLMSNLSEARIW